MPKYKIDYAEVEAKSKKVDEVTNKLKQIFFGIDKQIDQLMGNFKNWYLFPQFQERPIVINLYGMTGVGKTDLVNKLIQYMDLDKDKIYYNFAAIDELRAYEVEDDVEDDNYGTNPNKIFVLDEFQYAATLDEEGSEKKNRSALKPFWEVIDSGIFRKRMSFRIIARMMNTIKYLEYINTKTRIIMNNGAWVNEEECLNGIDPWLLYSMEDYLNFDIKKYTSYNPKKGSKAVLTDVQEFVDNDWKILTNTVRNLDTWVENCLLARHVLENFNEALKHMGDENFDEVEFYRTIASMEIESLIAYLKKIHRESMKGYNIDFSQSLIFVIANLDEAYRFSYDVDPDMPPNQFRKMSEKISIVDIKKALQKRFRNEQIARLGNIHIIYPSFDSETFKKIISHNLALYADKVRAEFGVDLTFDKSINDIIYKEGVFATQGTRPLFSTIYEVVKSKFPILLRHAYLNGFGDGFVSVRLSFVDKNVVANYLDKEGNEVSTLQMSQTLRVEDLRRNTKDNNQAISALHESGHFVVHYALTGKFPEKIVSRAATSGVGGFVLHSIDDNEFSTKKDYIDHIKICLGGYVAERLFFGDDDRTIGATNDLVMATQTAVKMVRVLGLFYNEYPFVTTKLNDNSDQFIYRENEDDIAEKASGIIRQCIKDVESLLGDDDWRGLLRASARYLSKHNAMKPAMMKRLCKVIPQEKRAIPRDNNYYVNLLNQL